MTNAKYVGKISPILYDNWTDNTPSYHSYYEFHMKRKAARKKLSRERAMFCISVIVIAFLILSVFTMRPQGSETYEDNRLHAVMSGDTLWSIANTYKDDSQTTGEFVYEIRKINSLKNSMINVGDLLIIPE